MDGILGYEISGRGGDGGDAADTGGLDDEPGEFYEWRCVGGPREAGQSGDRADGWSGCLPTGIGIWRAAIRRRDAEFMMSAAARFERLLKRERSRFLYLRLLVLRHNRPIVMWRWSRRRSSLSLNGERHRRSRPACSVDRVTLRVYRHLPGGIRLGPDLQIVSCDNEVEMLSLMDPTPGIDRFGEMRLLAVERLLWRMKNGVDDPVDRDDGQSDAGGDSVTIAGCEVGPWRAHQCWFGTKNNAWRT